MEENIYKGLASFIKANFNNYTVFRGLQNRTALTENCSIITILNKTIAGTPKSVMEFDYGIEMVGSQVFVTCQIDMYGDTAFDSISRLRTLLTHERGIKYFKEYGFAPVLVTEIRNLTGQTIINEEYIKRFSMDLRISYRDNTAVETEFIDEINIITQEVAYGIVDE